MDYDIKRGWYKKIEGDLLAHMMEDIFGNVKAEGDKLVSSFGVLERIEVTVIDKTKMDITTVNRTGDMEDQEILDTKRALNKFAEAATGFDVKARKKRAQDKAKKGLL